MNLGLSTMDKFDGTTKRSDLESVVGTWRNPEYDSGTKLVSVGDKFCIIERKDGSKFKQPSFVTWNSYFF